MATLTSKQHHFVNPHFLSPGFKALHVEVLYGFDALQRELWAGAQAVASEVQGVHVGVGGRQCVHVLLSHRRAVRVGHPGERQRKARLGRT